MRVCLGRGGVSLRRGCLVEERGGHTVLMAVSRVGLGPVCLAPKRRFMIGN